MRRQKPNQTDYLRVSTAFLDPLTKLFVADLNDVMRDAIIEECFIYSSEILQEAFTIIRRTSKRMPSVAAILEACNEARSAGAPVTHSKPHLLPGAQRERDIADLVKDYIKQRQDSCPLYHQAVREGWDMKLWSYLTDVATIQAQYLNPPVRHIWYNSMNIFMNESRPTGAQVREWEIKKFLAEQKQITQGGRIDVAVPTGLIQSWRERADQRRAAPAPSAPIPQELRARDLPKTLAQSVDLSAVF